MSIKKLAKNYPGVISGIRLAKRIVALARRRTRQTNNTGSTKSKKNVHSTLPSLDGRHRFVGYYDHSPFKRGDENLILVQSTKSSAWRRPSPNESVYIELVNHKNGTIVRKLGESYAWNWQQGARALWLNSESVVFNIYDEIVDKYRARVVDINGNHVEDLPIPVQEIDSKGRVYGLSYEALTAIRPDYGYRNKSVTNEALVSNAITQYDILTKNSKTLVRIKDLKKTVEKTRNKQIYKAKFNHISASPDATKLIFLFRYFVDEQRVTDLYVLSIETNELAVLVENAGVSHFCWLDNSTVVATMMGSKGFGYYKIDVATSHVDQLWKKEDGHPNKLDSTHILTDTYPDKYALRHLLIRDFRTHETKKLASFPEPLLFQGETRCDLHPTISPSGRYIQVDCAVGHKRTIAVLENPLFKE